MSKYSRQIELLRQNNYDLMSQYNELLCLRAELVKLLFPLKISPPRKHRIRPRDRSVKRDELPGPYPSCCWCRSALASVIRQSGRCRPLRVLRQYIRGHSSRRPQGRAKWPDADTNYQTRDRAELRQLRGEVGRATVPVFLFEDVQGRQLRSEQMTMEQALEAAKAFARRERDKSDEIHRHSPLCRSRESRAQAAGDR